MVSPSVIGNFLTTSTLALPPSPPSLTNIPLAVLLDDPGVHSVGVLGLGEQVVQRPEGGNKNGTSL